MDKLSKRLVYISILSESVKSLVNSESMSIDTNFLSIIFSKNIDNLLTSFLLYFVFSTVFIPNFSKYKLQRSKLYDISTK